MADLFEEEKAYMHRMNIRVSLDIYEWFKRKSARSGVSMSNLIYLALETHIQQQEMSGALPELSRLLAIQKAGQAVSAVLDD